MPELFLVPSNCVFANFFLTEKWQAIDLDPNDAIFLSNRSLCWLKMGQPEQALTDAQACQALRPNWAKACYREGAALRVLQVRVLLINKAMILNLLISWSSSETEVRRSCKCFLRGCEA